jgi:hypothetical protein
MCWVGPQPPSIEAIILRIASRSAQRNSPKSPLASGVKTRSSSAQSLASSASA